MLDRFVRLCEMASPTGSERAVADAVLAELRELGVEVAEDGAAGPARAGAGNLIARVPGRARRVGDVRRASRHRAPRGRRSRWPWTRASIAARGDTILGADNKAAVTILVELAARHAAMPAAARGSSWCSRSPRRTGCAGPRQLDLGALRSPFGFVLDHASPIGEVITAAPTYKRLVGRVRGHRGALGDPSRGRPQRDRGRGGRDRRDGARPPRRGDDGQRRRDRRRDRVERRAPATAASTARRGASTTSGPATAIGAMVDACTWAASEHDCDVDVEVDRDVPRLPAGRRASPAVTLARAALERRGVEPREVATGGGSDANALDRGAGSSACCSPTGPRRTTRPAESVAADRIVEMLGVCEAIVDGGGRSMLKLRRGVVVDIDPLTVEVDGERRPGVGRRRRWSARSRSATRWSSTPRRVDLGLGSGGFDVVHVNLTPRARRAAGRRGRARDEAQLHVAPAPGRAGRDRRSRRLGPRSEAASCPVLVAAAARAPGAARVGGRRRRGPGLRVGYVQTRRRRAARRAVARRGASCASAGCSPVTSPRAPAYGGEHEAISDSSGRSTPPPGGLGWDAILCRPGPGDPRLGDACTATAGWRRSTAPTRRSRSGLPTLLSPRLSSSDPRPRHRGLSHHTAAVLEPAAGVGAGPGAGDRARRMAHG